MAADSSKVSQVSIQGLFVPAGGSVGCPHLAVNRSPRGKPPNKVLQRRSGEVLFRSRGRAPHVSCRSRGPLNPVTVAAETKSLGFKKMKPYIRITRYPYEEPHHLNLVITASNGQLVGKLEFYLNADALTEWATEMEAFPRQAKSAVLWELGSARPEDRFAFYFRMRLFTVDGLGHGAIQLAFNNNEASPDREVSEFCIRSEAAQINRLGNLLRQFSKLNHQVLHWSLTDGKLYESIEDAEQAFAGDGR
jgi:hypothetical protein